MTMKQSSRIESIDIFRGFTIFMMVFVNDLAGVRGLPAWMGHALPGQDWMTFVDVVFPAFLFIVGMAIPFAVGNRISKGQTMIQIMRHSSVRIFGLLILGFFMVNAEEMNREANLIPRSIWNILLYISAIMIWNQYPKVEDWKRHLFRGMQAVGIVTLIFLWFTFRKGVDGNMGMTPSWWGILGLIGWAYAIAMAVYLVLKEDQLAIAAVLATFIIAVTGLKSEASNLPSWLTLFRGQANHLSHASLTLAGMLLGIWVKERDHKKFFTRAVFMTVFLFVAGYFLRPIHGIAKNGATPSWVLYSAGFCCITYMLMYWLADVKHWKRWATFLKPAGTNPLLTYILPFIFYAAIGYSFLPSALKEGAPGFIRSVIFSFFILGVAAILTRARVRLHL